MIQLGSNLQTENAFCGQLGNTDQVLEGMDIDMKLGDQKNMSNLECLGNKMKTESKPVSTCKIYNKKQKDINCGNVMQSQKGYG